ncbi:MAG: hypothetical protein IJR83_07160 [Clostridia bacterium]|nr:hypothetical protein [Clostridia bacterium]
MSGSKKRIGVLAVSVVLVLLILFTVIHSLSDIKPAVATVAMTESVSQTVVTGSGCIVRNERYVMAPGAGYTDALVRDGEKVSADQDLFNWYDVDSIGASAAGEGLGEIDAGLDFINSTEEAASRYSYASASEIRNQTYKTYAELIRLSAAGKFDRLQKEADSLLLTESIYKLLTGQEDLSELRTKLTRRRDSILQHLGEAVTVRSTEYGSGYFFGRSQLDGWENVLTPGFVDSVNADSLATALSAGRQDVPAAAAGKMVYGNEWYLLIPVTEDAAEKMKAGQSYSVSFDDQDVTVAMELLRVAGEADCPVLVLKTGLMPRDFSYERTQQVSLVIGTLTGFRIPESALAVYGGETGVFILDGSVVSFRRIDAVQTGDGYVLASCTALTEGNAKYLAKNDMMILQAAGMYDGKVLS